MEFHQENIKDHFDRIASEYDYWKKRNHYYYDTLKSFFKKEIPPGLKVLDLGCGTGDILASVEPKDGLGVDCSGEMLKIARKKHPRLRFLEGDAHTLELDKKFDAVILCDLLDHLVDVQQMLKTVHPLVRPGGKIAITTINPLWEPIFSIAEKLKMKMPEGVHNFVPTPVILDLLRLENFRVLRNGYRLFIPRRIPVLSNVLNGIVSRTPILKHLCAIQTIVAEPLPEPGPERNLSCSVIIPCLNEANGIAGCIESIPAFCPDREILVVDDGSTDSTADLVRAILRKRRDVRLLSYKPNRGKGKAVEIGFQKAKGEILMIFDADATVPPEELDRFYKPLNTGLARFVNGTRMIYPQEGEAMRQLNLLGNWMFARMLSFLCRRRLTDTLCGTKALYRKDFLKMKFGRDKWGDFDLIFGAAKIGLSFIEIPVHYKSRKTDQSKMKRFRHTLHLAHMCAIGFIEVFLPGLLKKRK